MKSFEETALLQLSEITQHPSGPPRATNPAVNVDFFGWFLISTKMRDSLDSHLLVLASRKEGVNAQRHEQNPLAGAGSQTTSSWFLSPTPLPILYCNDHWYFSFHPFP